MNKTLLTIIMFTGLITQSKELDKVNIIDLLDEEYTFVNCTLTNGQKMQATGALVSVGDIILSKEPSTAYISATAEFIEYKYGREILITVYKQFSGREDYQGIQVKYLNGSQQNKNMQCIEKNQN